jgi:ribosomal protein S18 acetylase RimI-like enzyme
MRIRAYQAADESAVIALWHECELVRPCNDPRTDIQRKMTEHPELFLVGLVEEELVATVMAGYEGHRGWISYLAVRPAYRHRGYGQQMMTEAEQLLRNLHCPKINLPVRTSNRSVIEFYQRLGYAVEEVVSLGKRLETDDKSAT